MAKKKVKAVVKLQCPAGAATPAPPVGPALGQYGINIGEFCKAFNAQTAEKQGLIIPALITIYTDRTFSFILKTPPTAVLIKKAARLAKGSPESNRNKVGRINMKQVREIAEIKLPDSNCHTIESCMEMVAGTARSLGVEVVD